MFKSYFKIGWRNLLANKGYSLINIGGLATGMAVAMLIGLWVYDELSFNKYHQNYDHLVQIMKGGTFQGRTYVGQRHLPFPLIEELQTTYQSNFKFVLPIQREENIVSFGDKNISRSCAFAGAGTPEAFSLKMLQGSWSGLRDPHSIMISASLAKALFGDTDPMNKLLQISHKLDVKVTGVYEDLPYNSEFKGVDFFAPWDLYVSNNPWMKNQGWQNHFLKIYAEIAPNHTIEQVNENIHEAEIKAIKNIPELANELVYSPVVMVHPMSDWHLYSNFKEGVRDSGPIQSLRIIATIGGFVLLLACINFMNLSTARSEKRAKEVGIRKSIGSLRSQLISQFFSESFLVVLIAFVFAFLLLNLALPWFNDLAGKAMQVPWTMGWFWITSLCFVLITGLLAGSYPALYLSSFNAMKVLKGTFRSGKLASLPRKALVVVQFTVSVSLIIGTVIVYNQITFAKDRPVGYTRDGLIMVQRKSDEFYSKTEALRNELKKSGVVMEMSESGGQITEAWSGNGGFRWEGKEPSDQSFATLSVSPEFGQTVGWQFLEGRDFSKEFASDSSGFVINESALKYMNLKNPVGQIVHWTNSAYGVNKDFVILGVIKDMIMESPFEKVKPTIFFTQGWHGMFNIKINPGASIAEAMQKIENVFRKIIPSAPFDFRFVDQEYALKFAAEERVGKLALVFSVLAIFISCLGLFGLASFVAEQRTKEIGIRKVVGASIFNLWQMLSRDFVLLSLFSCLLASPIAYFALSDWLQQYEYRTEISWWVFLIAGCGTIAMTLATVSFQAVKAALANPVNSLRSE